MELISGGIYIIKDEFFDLVDDPNILKNHNDGRRTDRGKRPHFLGLRNDKTGLCLMVPCTSNVDKYQKILKHYNQLLDNCVSQKRKEEIENKKLGFLFYNICGRPNVILFEKMFFVCDKFIKHPFCKNKSVITINSSDYQAFIEQVLKVLTLIRSGFKFTKFQPDFIKIEKLMISILSEYQINKI